MSTPILVPQPVATWSNSSYGAPLLESYNQRQVSGYQRSGNIWSEPYFRRIASQRPIALTVSVRQNQAQWLAFYNFWHLTLFDGHAWFGLDLENAGVTENFHAHLLEFRGAPREGTAQSFTRIEMNLEALLLDP